MFEPTNDPRQNLKQLAYAADRSLSFLSALLGHNAAYLQQFCERGSPKRLDPDDRLLLAKYFGVDERLLGARDPWVPEASPCAV